jgi:hypothetical protein
VSGAGDEKVTILPCKLNGPGEEKVSVVVPASSSSINSSIASTLLTSNNGLLLKSSTAANSLLNPVSVVREESISEVSVTDVPLVSQSSVVVKVIRVSVLAKNVRVKKVQSDQYARVPKHGRMLSLFDPVIGLVELCHHLTETKDRFPKKGSNSSLNIYATASLLVRSLVGNWCYEFPCLLNPVSVAEICLCVSQCLCEINVTNFPEPCPLSCRSHENNSCFVHMDHFTATPECSLIATLY